MTPVSLRLEKVLEIRLTFSTGTPLQKFNKFCKISASGRNQPNNLHMLAGLILIVTELEGRAMQ